MAEYVSNYSEPLNSTLNALNKTMEPQHFYLTRILAVQIIFYIIYLVILIVGISGNFLVCYVVYRNKAMQTVTNFFITNLGISDILMCIFAVPFTSLYTFIEDWIFGTVLCHTLPLIQSVSVYVSTLTLTVIAIDRYFVIVYPFKPRMKVWTCLLIIFCIWIFSTSIAIPYAIFMKHEYFPETDSRHCLEDWPSGKFKKAFGVATLVLQYVVPFLLITYCYVQISTKLNDRVKTKPGTKSSKKEEAEIKRKRRTNRMLIAMVTIFACCWLPLNVVNVIADFKPNFNDWMYFTLLFFMSHAIAMSSTCYNPLLYSWLNENFRKEFKAVLPCFTVIPNHARQSTTERTCINGTEARQSLIQNSDSIRVVVKNEVEGASAFYTAYSDKVDLKVLCSDQE